MFKYIKYWLAAVLAYVQRSHERKVLEIYYPSFIENYMSVKNQLAPQTIISETVEYSPEEVEEVLEESAFLIRTEQLNAQGMSNEKKTYLMATTRGVAYLEVVTVPVLPYTYHGYNLPDETVDKIESCLSSKEYATLMAAKHNFKVVSNLRIVSSLGIDSVNALLLPLRNCTPLVKLTLEDIQARKEQLTLPINA